jgi:hypothetical protein
MMNRVTKKRPSSRTQRAEHPLLPLVRERLQALGDYGHLRVALHGDHIVIAQPGPPEDPADGHPVLRLSGIGGFRFGVSLYRHTGHWEPVPISGVLNDVLAEAVTTLGPWLAPEPHFPGTSGTAY